MTLYNRLVAGAEFILDAPSRVASVWGDGDQVIWAEGEPFLIAGPPGVGKTTLAQQLTLARAGAADLTLLGHTVTPAADRKVLYIAADRPRQAQRSMRRMVEPRHRELLGGLLIWMGPLPFDVADQPSKLAIWLAGQGIGTVIVDSLKDVVIGLTDDKTMQAWNQALQYCVAEGIEIAVLHHQRKAQGDNRKPRALADVYGSAWITAGAGSVIVLWGEAGDSIVELTHLKQPAEQVGPFKVVHDHHAGKTIRQEPVDPVEMARAGDGGITVREAAEAMYVTANPSPNEIEKARRRLNALERDGDVERIGEGSSTDPVRYIAVRPRDPQRDPLTPDSRNGPAALTNATRDPSRLVSNPATPLKGAEAETVTPVDLDEAAA